MNEPQKCRLCGDLTSVVVNINLRATPVCDPCCLLITKQTVSTLTVESLEIATNPEYTRETQDSLAV